MQQYKHEIFPATIMLTVPKHTGGSTYSYFSDSLHKLFSSRDEDEEDEEEEMVETEVQLFGELVERMERLLESDVALQHKLVAAGDWLSTEAEDELLAAESDELSPRTTKEMRGSTVTAGEVDARSTAAMMASAASMAVMSGQVGVGLHVTGVRRTSCTPSALGIQKSSAPPAIGIQRSWLSEAEGGTPQTPSRKRSNESGTGDKRMAV